MAQVTDCPYCKEAINLEAAKCKHCESDLRLAQPVIAEIRNLLVQQDQLRRKLRDAEARLAFLERPLHLISEYFVFFIVLPTTLLLAAHYLITVEMDVSAIYLRVASVFIPLPFGAALFVFWRVGFRRALFTGIITALLSISGMLLVIAYIDNASFLPGSRRDWLDTLQYSASIALAYVSGNILALVIYNSLAGAQVETPSAAAEWLARRLDEDMDQAVLQKRARHIHELINGVGPKLALIISTGSSIYTGLSKFLGPDLLK